MDLDYDPRMLEIVDHAGLDRSALSDLRRELAGVRTLEDVIRSCGAAGLVEVVTQDEYIYDVVVRWREATHLVFDST